MDSLKTRAIQSDFDLTNKDETSSRSGGNLNQQRSQTQSFPSAGNNPNSLTEELNRQRNANSGNALNRLFNDKLGGGSSNGRRGGGGGGGRAQASLSEDTGEYVEQRTREESCCIRRPHVIRVGYGKPIDLYSLFCRLLFI